MRLAHCRGRVPDLGAAAAGCTLVDSTNGACKGRGCPEGALRGLEHHPELLPDPALCAAQGVDRELVAKARCNALAVRAEDCALWADASGRGDTRCPGAGSVLCATTTPEEEGGPPDPACDLWSECVDGVLGPPAAGSLGGCIAPGAALLNHSCAPNCVVSFGGRWVHVRTLRPVAAGEQLCISYGPLASREGDPAVRRAWLRARYHFTCSCSACQTDRIPPTLHSSRAGESGVVRGGGSGSPAVGVGRKQPKPPGRSVMTGLRCPASTAADASHQLAAVDAGSAGGMDAAGPLLWCDTCGESPAEEACTRLLHAAGMANDLFALASEGLARHEALHAEPSGGRGRAGAASRTPAPAQSLGVSAPFTCGGTCKDLEQAVQCITECLSLRREVMVPSSPRVAVAEALAAQVLTHAGRYVDALALCETNVLRLQARFGRTAVECGDEYGKLAHIACLAGKPSRALEAVAAARACLAPLAHARADDMAVLSAVADRAAAMLVPPPSVSRDRARPHK